MNTSNSQVTNSIAAIDTAISRGRKIKTYENIKIFQGDQIGGCVTVISSTVNGETHRIMIDYGSSLEGSGTVKDFDYLWDEEPVDAVFFTHYHSDHVGRIGEIPKSVRTLYMGETARKVMINIQSALTRTKDAEKAWAELKLLNDDARISTFKKTGAYTNTSRIFPDLRLSHTVWITLPMMPICSSLKWRMSKFPEERA